MVVKAFATLTTLATVITSTFYVTIAAAVAPSEILAIYLRASHRQHLTLGVNLMRLVSVIPRTRLQRLITETKD